MTTFSIVEDASVGASAVSAGVIASVKSNILAAAELWNRYFVQGAFDIKIELIFADIPGSTLATGGSGLSFSGFGGPGLEVWKVDSIEEFITGGEVDGSAVDIVITVDTPLLLAGDFFFDPDPFSRTAAVPAGKNDFMSVMLHELGHGFGFGSFSLDGMDTVDDSGSPDAPDVSPFDLWVDPDASGGRSFVGPTATALFGGDIILDPGSSSHIAKASDGGFENLMDPSLLVGSRSFIAPIHIAMLDDIGFPIRKPTASADVLFGFEFVDDTISLAGGDDSYNGLSGDDFVLGGIGADTLLGETGDDTLKGGSGADQLFAGFGDDRAEGGAGSDLILGGPGKDTLIGGADNDTLGGSNRSDLLRGGTGADLVLGSNGNDRLFGDDGADTLKGGSGRDTLNGGADADRLVGGGNAGDLATYVDSSAGVFVRLWAGDGTGGDAQGDTLIEVEFLTGSAFGDTLHGTNGTNRIEGGSGNDLILGLGADDFLIGGAGTDTLTGGAGDDQFWHVNGDGSDTITDFVAGGASGDVIRLFGHGVAFDTFGEVIGAASQVGGDVVISFGGGDFMTLSGVTLGDLNAGDFLFG